MAEQDFKTKQTLQTFAMDNLTSTATPIFSLLFTNQPILDQLIHLLRRFLLFSFRLLFLLLSPFLTPPNPTNPNHYNNTNQSLSSNSAAPSRALSHLLTTVSTIPVSSRKYEFIRSLTDRILDQNLNTSYATNINVEALCMAFARTLQRLESLVHARSYDGIIVNMVKRFVVKEEEEGSGGKKMVVAEKLAAEVLWLVRKMEECGAADEAVVMWSQAAELGRVAVEAEVRIQVAFVKVSVFLFKHANSKQFGRKVDDVEDDNRECLVVRYRMAMLTSWLPLLCRASNGIESPILSRAEKAEMVKVLEEMIENLSSDQQELVLALWLHHFTSSPDTDWPNLESCYTRWYSQSRNLLLLK